MLYKTLFLPQNLDYEYQSRNGVWYRRRKGSKDKWSKPNADGVTILNNAYKGKPKLFFYSKTALIGGVVLAGILGYVAYKKFVAKPPIL
jgi:hypothetical protein